MNGGLFFKDYMSKVVDVTIAYPNGQPLNLWSIVSGSRPPCVTHVHYRVFDIKEVIFRRPINIFCSAADFIC